ncbi:hypothetical protein [Dasania marina]|uniref:hypothetical protein n=1 Tax=Dasania marina TaxID=471499 RepID=UPI0003673B50|nr:hypothetical protein [Dasania marina]
MAKPVLADLHQPWCHIRVQGPWASFLPNPLPSSTLCSPMITYETTDYYAVDHAPSYF